MCVTLIGKNGSKLDEKCTRGSFGEPYLASDKRNIKVPFDSVDAVASIKVGFNDLDYPGQIGWFIVRGISNSIPSFTNQGLQIFLLTL